MTSTSTPLGSAPPSGMRDFLPAEVALRDWATAAIIRTYERFGFTRIETPALENINLLRRGEGGENLQLIFEVLKRGDKLEKELKCDSVNRLDLADLGLRFDLTVPLVRFYANNQGSLPSPFKSIQIGSVWRAESPQHGRYRQFTQCDIDIIGVKSEIAETELLQASATALLELGFNGFTIRINDRRILTELAEFCGFSEERFDSVFIAVDKLDKIGLAGVKAELGKDGHPHEAIEKLLDVLHRVRDDQSGQLKEAHKYLPHTLPEDVYRSLQSVIDAVTAQSQGRYDIKFDPTLVRGMGYYTGQIFEISCPGYSSSVGGGGRYDKMVGKFSGRDTPACGFSIGFERIINILQEKNFKPPTASEKIALICEPDRDSHCDILAAAAKLRDRASVVSIQVRKKDMKKQLDALLAQGFDSFCVYKGDVNALDVKPLGQNT